MPVILVTGYAPGDALSDMEVIRKPFRPEVLADRVRAKFEQLRTDADENCLLNPRSVDSSDY